MGTAEGLRPTGTAALRYVAEPAATGYGVAADRLVRAIRAAGVRLEYRGLAGADTGDAPVLVSPFRDERCADQAPAGAPTVAHLVPEHYRTVRSIVPPGPFIGHTVWETDALPKHWPELLNEIDLVIVPTPWNREVFTGSGVTVPVAVVPHVACEPSPGDGGLDLNVPDHWTVFYSIGRWDQRKAMFHTLRAYLDAFSGDDPVVLVIKTGLRTEMPPVEAWGTSDPMAWTTGWQVAYVVSRYRNPARVRLEVAEWSDEQIAGLHHRGDCYISLSRGEGWNIGAFDACAYGNPVVATGWGGVLEFLDPESAWLVRSSLISVEHQASASYSPDQRWAEPDLGHAVELLHDVATDLDGARARAVPLRDQVLMEYAPDRVAKKFVDTLAAFFPRPALARAHASNGRGRDHPLGSQPTP